MTIDDTADWPITYEPRCRWDQAIDSIDSLADPIDVHGAIVFRTEDYDPSLLPRFMARMQSIGDFLQELGVDFWESKPVDEPVQEPPKRDDLWGFAPGDRVRYAADNAAKGLIGKVIWTGGCSIAKLSESCRDICPNVQVMFTHRQCDGNIAPTTVGPMTVPPGHLEHID